MRKAAIIILLATAAAVSLGYVAYGQSQEYIDRIKKADPHIRFLKEVQDAIDTIEKERIKEPRVSKMKIYNVVDLLVETRIPNYDPMSPFVRDTESSNYGGVGGIRFNGHDDSSDRGYDPDDIVEIIRAKTGEDHWPEEAGGFGTIEHHRGKLLVINTPKILDKIEAILRDMRKSLPPPVLSTIFLLNADESYLAKLRKKGSSVITPEAMKKILSDCAKGEDIELLRTGYLTSYSAQSVNMFCGTSLAYNGDTDTSGAGGLTPFEVFDPIINVFHEGLIIGLSARYNSHTKHTNISAMISLSEVTSIEEHTGIGGGLAGPEETHGVSKCKVETPKVDMQIVSGSADVPEGYGLLLGGSRLKTSQARQKSFVVLVVPRVQK